MTCYSAFHNFLGPPPELSGTSVLLSAGAPDRELCYGGRVGVSSTRVRKSRKTAEDVSC